MDKFVENEKNQLDTLPDLPKNHETADKVLEAKNSGI